jgi:trimethylamine---corrinoid protein Co-methyltransferase
MALTRRTLVASFEGRQRAAATGPSPMPLMPDSPGTSEMSERPGSPSPAPRVRPGVRFLSGPLIDRILDEARGVLGEIGVEVHHPEVAELLLSAGARADDSSKRIRIGADLIDRALATVAGSFTLHDRDGAVRADLGGLRVHFTPGSAAINVLDAATGAIRPPTTCDYVRYARLVEKLPAYDYPSTAFIPNDVPEAISDAYRLFLSLMYGSGPVVTGAFTIEGFQVMADLLLAVRGTGDALARQPLAVFSCCPTAPLTWSGATSKNVIDCARRRIPVEIISVPLTGFVAPGTLAGTLAQHTAENLSGVVMSQIAGPGAPLLWGGSSSIFDYRHETTPLGAIESQMLNCGHAEIGRRLGLPTQAYISPSDAKSLDAQAGLESAHGILLAALAGINSVSGPGMLDFESCQSLEKLVLDHEICLMARRVTRGIEEREGDFPIIPHMKSLLREGHSIIADHTRRWTRHEVAFPGPVIDRMTRARHIEEGSPSLAQRARDQVEALAGAAPNLLDDERRRRLSEVMTSAARAAGMDRLPSHEP